MRQNSIHNDFNFSLLQKHGPPAWFGWVCLISSLPVQRVYCSVSPALSWDTESLSAMLTLSPGQHAEEIVEMLFSMIK